MKKEEGKSALSTTPSTDGRAAGEAYRRRITGKIPLIVLLGVALVFVVDGCSKKKGDAPSSGDYYFKFSAGNQSFTYDANSYASFSNSDGLFLVGIGGFKDMAVGNKNVASVLVGSTDAIGQSSYSGLVYPDNGGNSPAVFLSWIDGNGKTFGSLYQDNATDVVTITELTASSVKGKFSGKIYDVTSPGDAINYSGEFYVKRMN